MNQEESNSQENSVEITIDGKLQNGKVILPTSEDAFQIFDESYIGVELASKEIELEIIEALILLERKRIRVLDQNHNELTAEEILSQAVKNNERIWTEYLVYRDLRRRGYIVRGGFGEGIDFRVYRRGANRKEDVAKFFVVILAEDNPVYFELFDKITHQTIKARKELILAIVDRLGDVTYYKLDHIKFTENKYREQVDI